jgi:sec-independent protein translocase protein TatB
MFDFSWSEILVIGIAALIFIGPKELPGVLRAAGQWMGKIRRMAGEFQNQFQEALREAELADLKKEVDEMSAHAASMSNFDPVGVVRKEMEGARRDIEASLTEKPADRAKPAETAPTPSNPAPSDQGSAETPASDAPPAVAPIDQASTHATAAPDGAAAMADAGETRVKEPAGQDAPGRAPP